MPAAPLNLLPIAPASGQPAAAPGASAGAGAGVGQPGQGAAAGFHAMVAAIFGAVTVGDTAPAAGKAAPATAGDAPKKGQGDATDGEAAPGADAQALAASLFFTAPAAVQPQQAQTGEAVDATATGDKGKTAAAALAASKALPADAATDEAGDAAEVLAPAAGQAEADPKGKGLALGQGATPATKAVPATPGQAPATPAVPATPAAAAQNSAPPAAPVAAAETPQLPQEPVQAAPAVQTADVPPEPVAPAPAAEKPKTAARVEPGQTGAASPGQAPPADAEEAPRPLTPVAGANAKVADKPSEGPPAAAAPEVDVAARRDDGPRAPDAAPQTTSAAAAAAPPPQHTATAVVRGAPETVASLAADIVKKLDGQSTRFDVQLDPAGLGKVDVRVEIGAQGRLTATLNFDNPQAAAELRGRSGELHRALEQAGFDTSGGLSFNSGQDQGQSGQFLAQQQQQQGDSGGWRGRAFQAALDVAGEASEGAIASSLQLQRRTDTGVDIRI